MLGLKIVSRKLLSVHLADVGALIVHQTGVEHLRPGFVDHKDKRTPECLLTVFAVSVHA